MDLDGVENKQLRAGEKIVIAGVAVGLGGLALIGGDVIINHAVHLPEAIYNTVRNSALFIAGVGCATEVVGMFKDVFDGADIQ